MILPSLEEERSTAFGEVDPLGEKSDQVAPGLTHRYPDRVLFVVTSFCTSYCRFCIRKRNWHDSDAARSRGDVDQALAYIRAHPEIRDVLVSGGDPLTLPLEAARLRARRIARDPARRDRPLRLARARAAADAHHARARRRARAARAGLAEHPLQSPARDHGGRGARGRSPAARGHSGEQPVGAAARRERFGRRDARARAGPAAHQGAPLLSLSLRRRGGRRAPAHQRAPRARDPRGPARTHDRLRDSDLRGRRAGRGRKDPADAQLSGEPGREQPGRAQLRGRARAHRRRPGRRVRRVEVGARREPPGRRPDRRARRARRRASRICWRAKAGGWCRRASSTTRAVAPSRARSARAAGAPRSRSLEGGGRLQPATRRRARPRRRSLRGVRRSGRARRGGGGARAARATRPARSRTTRDWSGACAGSGRISS